MASVTSCVGGPEPLFVPSKRLAYVVLGSLARLDVDLELAACLMGKAVENCLVKISREEERKRRCSTAVLVMDGDGLLQAWFAYKLLESFGLYGKLNDNKKVVALLTL